MNTDVIRVDAGGWGLTWAVDESGILRQVGLGPAGHDAALDVETRWFPTVLPTWGDDDPYRPAALRVAHAEGTTTTRLVVVDTRRDVTEDGRGEHLVVTLRDELHADGLAFSVEIHLRTDTSGVLEQWVEIVHDESGPVTLFDYDSLFAFLLVAHDAELTQFGGSGWADEWSWTTQHLHPGTTSLTSYGGLQPHLQRSPVAFVSPHGPAEEEHGDIIGLSVAWGGNTRIDLDVRPVAEPDAPRQLRLRAGANPHGAHYVLDPGVRFVTPTVAWTWSSAGRRELTRRFHDWTRARVMRDPDDLRPLVVNNWEATFFDFDQDRLVGLIDRAAQLDADVFLLDDGWFGTNHPRDDDTTSLGDWDPDPRKLPDGLSAVADAATERGVRFGIWVEPEMVNPVSDLHAAHPEWVLRDRREPRLHRHQLALDPLDPEARDFMVDAVDRTLAAAGSASYVKWDANRPVTDPGSAHLAPDRQSNLWVDHVHATWAVMDEVVRGHPEVELMLCASGGGRTDHGTLRRFHEFWTSDNTDPVTRVRMQWACGHVFPAAVTAAHVTRWGERPMPFACAAALSARFGIDLDLGTASDEELVVLGEAVRVARRTQDLVQRGELVRLVSPVEGTRDRAAFAYLSAARDRAVLFAYQLDAEPVTDRWDASELVLRLPDLIGAAPDDVGTGDATRYRVSSTDLETTDELVLSAEEIGAGLRWTPPGPCTARIWDITRT